MLKSGSIVKGTITGIKDYGAFVKVDNFDGLIHISEFSDDYVKSISEIIKVGEVVDLKVLGQEKISGKLKLSFKQANNIPLKLKKAGNIQIGFKTLEDYLPQWVNQAYKRLKK
ncbi:MAG: S1 RNA-binding domain-containing protein [Erysipelotrichales bacterium]|nr:S1 RNA-binding domain-containing protein [Erysipelotrichales bacterium]